MDGVAGVTEVSVVDVTTGAVQQYALTTDSEFTRSIQPVGIGVAYDGTACFIADASAARVVKIPRGNATDITDTYGNYTGWSFPDPCNMDTSTSGLLYVPDANAVRGVTPTYTYVDIWITGVRGILMDREASTDGTNRYFMTIEAGHAEVFNLNPIEYGSGPPYSESPARYLGGIVWGLNDGRLRLDPDWYYGFQRQTPQKVLLTNVRPEWPYQSPDQSVDHVVKLEVEGWYGVPLKLRLVDPPDLAPYDAKSLDDPTGYTEFPYHAGDNVYPSTDWGLTLNADDSDPHQEITAVPNATNILTFYLKVPPDVSGNNFQVQVIKCDADTGTPVPERMVSISPVYTTWKRIYLERERMFRRGNFLHPVVGEVTPDIDNDPDSIYLYRWPDITLISDPLYVQPMDWIVLFDTENQYPFGVYEEAQIMSTAFVDVGGNPVLEAVLDRDLKGNYLPSPLTFTVGHSAAVGVISCDISFNQINQAGSCFYDADLRDIERPFAEAFTEYLAPSDDIGTVPFLYGIGTPERWQYAWLWDSHQNEDTYMHIFGAARNPVNEGVLGTTRRWLEGGDRVRASMVHVRTLEENAGGSGSACFFLKPAYKVIQGVINHELAHQFAVNILNQPDEHCHSKNWMGEDEECMMHIKCSEPGHIEWCPGVDPNRLDADASSATSANQGDTYDVRLCVETLP